MKNLTISLDDELHRAVRIEAAKAGKSISRYVADNLRQMQQDRGGSLERLLRLEALERVFAGPKLPISQNGKMPTAEERNACR